MLTCILLAASMPSAAAPMLIGDVAVNARDIVFAYAGDLWRVPRIGGVARRMFSDGSSRSSCVFSPDGTRLAYSRINSNDIDVYVTAASGGEEQRLTWHPKGDFVRGWSADGKRLLFTSDREQDGASELYTIGFGDPLETRMPAAYALHGALSPDSKKLAFTPRGLFYTNVMRRFYRGGSTSPLWILDLATGSTEKVTDGSYNVITPMWVGREIYFGSDKLGSFNLAVYDTSTRKIRELTTYPVRGITSLGYGSGTVVFVRDGRIHLYDLSKKTVEQVPVTIDQGDLRERDERAPRATPLLRYVNGLALSFDGKQAALECRGEVLAGESSTPAATNLTKTAGAAERGPAFSPDGKRIAYFSDESGEYALHVRDLATSEVRKIAIEPNPTYYRELQWSPDGRRLSFSGQRLELWCVDLASGRPTKVDESAHLAQGLYHARWSPDGRWLAYSKALPTRVRAVFLWDSASAKAVQVSDGISQDENPVFDRSGRYLYFSSSATARNAPAADIGWGLQSSMLNEPYTTRNLAVVVLGASDVGPAQSPEVPGSGRVDLEGISRRILPMPVTGLDIVGIEAGPAGSVYLSVQEWSPNAFAGPSRTSLYRYDATKSQAPEKLADDAVDFTVSGDGSLVLYAARDGLHLAGASTGAIDLKDAKVEVDPTKEWRQIYREAWRMMRDYFYDPNHHGQDPAELETHYAEYLPSITRRSDLNVLLARAFGEISISHLRVTGGDTQAIAQPPSSRVGVLGADFSVQGGQFRIDRVLTRGHYGQQRTRAPLDQPGMDVRPGDVLAEIAGKPVTADRNLYSYLEGTLNRPTKIKLVRGGVAREMTVTPIPGENGLRSDNWARANEAKVRQLSGGRLAYVYIAGYDEAGYADLSRVLNASGDKQGLIIDQRFNGGGITPDTQINALQRTPLLAYAYRYGKEITVPAHWINGPKVLILNEANGSAAETFALMFKANKVGTLVGKTTFGAGIGTALFQQPMVDNGIIAIPNRASYNPHAGTWDAENEGIHPHVDVEIMPSDWIAGRDPQLEAAVRVALQNLQSYRGPSLRKPTPPVHAGGRKPRGVART